MFKGYYEQHITELNRASVANPRHKNSLRQGMALITHFTLTFNALAI